MTSKVYIVTDLGPGDGGKGGVVHAVAKSQRAHTIIKRGGAQGSHGVHTSRGETFAFSQWGCGTFDGIPTHLSEQMIVSPEGLLNESDQLRRQFGIDNPFAMLSVDRRALVATPLHGVASHLLELSRGSNPRGTIGAGVGQAYRDDLRYPELTLRMKDLKNPNLREQLYEIRENIRNYILPVVNLSRFLPGDRELVNQEVALLQDDGFVENVAERFAEAASLTHIVEPDYLGSTILARPGCAVIETSHGVLTDNVHGFAPHTSAIRTLPRFTRQILDRAGYEGQVVNLGVTRAYAIRHGAGPLPTTDPTLAEQLLPGSHKQDNRWQGEVRVGALDGVLLRYAVRVCGGAQAFDGLAVTWFDQIKKNREWLTADSYRTYSDDRVFASNGELRVIPETTEHQQGHFTTALGSVEPHIESLKIAPEIGNDALYGICAEKLEAMTDIPVRMVSFGPTERDKLMK
ncbi:adenylosuccinate synthetase [Candidatus Saccharibacteria bacterium]|nr:adenylosuccinate synthetase [Candidatus Saccharibacteria bacterium]